MISADRRGRESSKLKVWGLGGENKEVFIEIIYLSWPLTSSRSCLLLHSSLGIART